MKTFTRMLLVVALAGGLWAQQPAKDAPGQPAKDQSSKNDVLAGGDGLTGNFYKLTFVMYELDDGKRTNQREYMMIVKAEYQPSSIKVSTRVPIYTEQTGTDKKITYIDAGLILRCSLKEQVDHKLQFHSDNEISGFARPEQIANSGNASSFAPVLRTTRTESWALLTLGKPAVFTTVDDINSTKRMQIEVTATKVE
jgi:hypothetical protein